MKLVFVSCNSVSETKLLRVIQAFRASPPGFCCMDRQAYEPWTLLDALSVPSYLFIFCSILILCSGQWPMQRGRTKKNISISYYKSKIKLVILYIYVLYIYQNCKLIVIGKVQNYKFGFSFSELSRISIEGETSNNRQTTFQKRWCQSVLVDNSKWLYNFRTILMDSFNVSQCRIDVECGA